MAAVAIKCQRLDRGTFACFSKAVLIALKKSKNKNQDSILKEEAGGEEGREEGGVGRFSKL